MVRNTAARRAFTLIELLVVIAIIGVLAALTTAAVIQVRKKGKELEVRNDLTQLDTAIGSFRAKMSNAPIPSGGRGTPWTAGQHDMAGTFRLCSAYGSVDAMGNFTYFPGFTANDPEIAILKRMFPRMDLADNGLRRNAVPATYTVGSSNLNTDGITGGAANAVLLDSNQCLVFFLSGGSFTEYTGFSSDPFHPFEANNPTKRLANGAFFDFPKGRMKAPNAYGGELEFDQYIPNGSIRFANDTDLKGRAEPWFLDPWKSPYIYFASQNSNDYQSSPCAISPWGGAGSGRNYSTYFANGTKPILTWTTLQNPSPLKESATKFFNPKTHQIISMGPDGVLGVSSQPNGSGVPAAGLYQAGDSEWTLNLAGSDDYANFRSLKLGATGND